VFAQIQIKKDRIMLGGALESYRISAPVSVLNHTESSYSDDNDIMFCSLYSYLPVKSMPYPPESRTRRWAEVVARKASEFGPLAFLKKKHLAAFFFPTGLATLPVL
jgi:hypothetical protein